MDRHWYHVLLKGAVEHAGKIEKRNAAAMPFMSLGQTISEASGKVTYFGFKMDTGRRLQVFYAAGAVLIAAIFLSLTLATAASPQATTTNVTRRQLVRTRGMACE